MIILPIKRKWYDMILCGEKKEEYRNITPRYKTMFSNASDENGNFWLILRNGYSCSSPSVKIYVNCSIGRGNPSWGADPELDYFVLRILKKERCSFN